MQSQHNPIETQTILENTFKFLSEAVNKQNFLNTVKCIKILTAIPDETLNAFIFNLSENDVFLFRKYLLLIHQLGEHKLLFRMVRAISATTMNLYHKKA